MLPSRRSTRAPQSSCAVAVAAFIAVGVFACSTSTHGDTDAGGPGPPCGVYTICPADMICYFPIGSCTGQGNCFPIPKNPECGIVTGYCGCNGEQVYGRCGDPDGYANKPTTGGSTGVCAGSDAGSAVTDAHVDADSD